jgi:hypothetical protein
MPNCSHSPLMVCSSRSYSSTNRAFSSITLLALHGMPSFYMPPGFLQSVRIAPGLYLGTPSPLPHEILRIMRLRIVSPQIFHSKGLTGKILSRWRLQARIGRFWQLPGNFVRKSDAVKHNESVTRVVREQGAVGSLSAAEVHGRHYSPSGSVALCGGCQVTKVHVPEAPPRINSPTRRTLRTRKAGGNPRITTDYGLPPRQANFNQATRSPCAKSGITAVEELLEGNCDASHQEQNHIEESDEIDSPKETCDIGV